MTRDFNYEHKLYEIEDSPELNGYILMNLLYNLKACSVEQLAIAFYLYRFPKVSIQILGRSDSQIENLYLFNEYEMFNLDILLMPLLSEKYNVRFKNGFKHLLSYSLLNIKQDLITLNTNYLEQITHQLENSNSIMTSKVKVATIIIQAYNINELNYMINKIAGEINNG
ncbi:hypothetical protein MKX47_20200 [Solibacillus sp. FSL R7-0668]|uniref:hypothetical protein n=1 Tax=Solibacillus sp. FSL R7-0668 TaxID=2921688 RepID=UPI0030FB169C